MNSIQQDQVTVKRFVRLSTGQMVEVPTGADPAAFRRVQEARLRAKANPRRKAGSRTRRNSKRTNYAQQVVARAKAQAELVGRVNGKMTEAETEARQAAWEAANPDMETGGPF